MFEEKGCRRLGCSMHSLCNFMSLRLVVGTSARCGLPSAWAHSHSVDQPLDPRRALWGHPAKNLRWYLHGFWWKAWLSARHIPEVPAHRCPNEREGHSLLREHQNAQRLLGSVEISPGPAAMVIANNTERDNLETKIILVMVFRFLIHFNRPLRWHCRGLNHALRVLNLLWEWMGKFRDKAMAVGRVGDHQQQWPQNFHVLRQKINVHAFGEDVGVNA